MGGGKNQTQANQQLSSQASYQENQQKDFDKRNSADMDESRAKSNALYDSLKGSYSSLAGKTAGDVAASGGGGGGGGYETDSRLSDVEAKYRGYMKGGGWSDDQNSSQTDTIAKLKSIGETGGMDAESQARARGLGVYDEFAKTGGLTDADKANLRSRGNAGIPAMYSQMKDTMARQQAVQGGYGPGASVMGSRMARQQAGAMQDATRDTELGILDKTNEGRKWGAAGASSSELSLQNLLNSNKLAGLTGAGDMQQKLVESVREGEQYGTEGLKGLANDQMSRNAAASAQSAASSRWEQQFAFQQEMAGLGGLQSLYTDTPGEYQEDKKLQLGSSSTYGNQINQGSSAQKSGNKSVDWGKIAGAAGTAAMYGAAFA